MWVSARIAILDIQSQAMEAACSLLPPQLTTDALSGRRLLVSSAQSGSISIQVRFVLLSVTTAETGIPMESVLHATTDTVFIMEAAFWMLLSPSLWRVPITPSVPYGMDPAVWPVPSIPTSTQRVSVLL